MQKDILLKTFFSLSKTLSFKKTAEELGISQQAVSSNISRLEKKLGVSLVERNSRNVSITEWGREFSEIALEYDQKLAHLKERFIRQQHAILIQTLGHINISVLRDLKEITIPDYDANIKIETEINTPGAAVSELLQGKCDMIVTLDRFLPDCEEMNVQELYPLNVFLLVAKDHPLYHENVSWEAFRNEPFLAGSPIEKMFDGTQDYIERDIEYMELTPSKVILKTSLNEVEKGAALQEGIVMASYADVQFAPKNLAAVPTGKTAKIICAWRADSSKKILPKAAKGLKAFYENYFSQGFGLSAVKTV